MAAQFVINQLPEPLQEAYNQYYVPYASHLQPYARAAYNISQSVVFKWLYPTAWGAYNVVQRLSGGDNSDLTLKSLFLTVIMGLVSVYFMNFVRRRLFALVYTLLSFIFWGILITLSVFAYSRGFQQTIDDLSDLVHLFFDSREAGKRRGNGKARQKEYEASKAWGW